MNDPLEARQVKQARWDSEKELLEERIGLYHNQVIWSRKDQLRKGGKPNIR